MSSTTRPPFIADARDRLAMLIDEMSASEAHPQRAELDRRIRLAEELLRVADRQGAGEPIRDPDATAPHSLS